MVSETIKDMADTYQENVGTNKTDSEIYLKNRQAFIGELLNIY